MPESLAPPSSNHSYYLFLLSLLASRTSLIVLLLPLLPFSTRPLAAIILAVLVTPLTGLSLSPGTPVIKGVEVDLPAFGLFRPSDSWYHLRICYLQVYKPFCPYDMCYSTKRVQ